jgi:hypothetical protein
MTWRWEREGEREVKSIERKTKALEWSGPGEIDQDVYNYRGKVL